MSSRIEEATGAGEGAAPMRAVGYLLDDRRAQDLAARIPREGDLPDLGVSRAVIFLTQRCNMACRYCLSIRHEMPPWREDELFALLEQLSAAGTRHVQWTGGEATLDPRLADFVGRSATLGMSNSISTNCTAPVAQYQDLVMAGMKRFYVSVDVLDGGCFDTITRSQGRLPHVLAVIDALCGLRERGHDIHVTINTVLSRDLAAGLLADRAAGLRSFLTWLCGSGADDFKFLPDAAETLPALFGGDELFARFLAVCVREVPGRFLMFHHRLRTIGQGGHGFSDGRRRLCFQCLDDRTFDSAGAYPCVIHLREGGERLYARDDPEDLKRKQLGAFLRQDRSRDPICRRCCFDLYRGLNERVEFLLRNGADAHN